MRVNLSRLPNIGAISLAVSLVVGSGVFGIVGLAVSKGAGNSILAWLLVSISILPFLVIFNALGKRLPEGKGLSDYVRYAFGERLSKAVSLLLICTFVLLIPSVAFIGASYMKSLWGLPESSTHGLSMLVIVFGTALNLLGSRWLRFISRLSFYAVLLVLVYTVAWNYSYALDALMTFGSVETYRTLSLPQIWNISVVIFFAFIGWESLSWGSKDLTHGTNRNLGSVYFLSWAFVACLYLSLALVVAGAMLNGVGVTGVEGLMSLIEKLPGGKGVAVVAVLLFVANVAAWVFGASQMLYAASSKGQLPSIFLGTQNNKAPHICLGFLFILYMSILALKFTCRIDIEYVVQLVVQNNIVIYVLSIATYLKTEHSRSSKAIGALSLVCSAFLLSGFSWHFVVPTSILLVGWTAPFRRRQHSNGQPRVHVGIPA